MQGTQDSRAGASGNASASTGEGTELPSAAADAENRRRSARRELLVFLGVALPVSLAIELWMISVGSPIDEQPLGVVALMWTPALASLVARLVTRAGVRDVSFRIGGLRGLGRVGIAWAQPIAVGLAAYGACWAAGLATFVQPDGYFDAPAPVRFALRLLLIATLGTAISAITALGEEIGWRGFMLTRLFDAGVPRPVLVSGVIWGLWHVPLIASGQYASSDLPALSIGIFLIDILAASYLAAWLRLTSGSLWPAAMFHAAWNAIIQGGFDEVTQGGKHLIGESGIVVAIVDVAILLLIAWRPWQLLRRPGEELGPAKRLWQL